MPPTDHSAELSPQRALPGWVREARRIPVAFAQVREDALLDLSLADRLPVGASVLLVASGGCTAAALLAHARIGRIRLVDPNPAQIALARVKLHAAANLPAVDRMKLLGHAPMPDREQALARVLAALGLPADSLGPPGEVAQAGPDQWGRYESLFAALRAELAGAGESIRASLTEGRNPEAEALRSLDAAFNRVMDLPNLVALFSEAATGNAVVPFAEHFAARTRVALARPDAGRNPYLAQVLFGRFGPGHVSPWLTQPRVERPPEISWRVAAMRDALDEGDRHDLVHLSNILDWLGAGEAEQLLHAAWRALKPGGLVVIRQLNSSLAIRQMDTPVAWLEADSEQLLGRDRSYFYRQVHLGARA